MRKPTICVRFGKYENNISTHDWDIMMLALDGYKPPLELGKTPVTDRDLAKAHKRARQKEWRAKDLLDRMIKLHLAYNRDAGDSAELIEMAKKYMDVLHSVASRLRVLHVMDENASFTIMRVTIMTQRYQVVSWCSPDDQFCRKTGVGACLKKLFAQAPELLRYLDQELRKKM